MSTPHNSALRTPLQVSAEQPATVPSSSRTVAGASFIYPDPVASSKASQQRAISGGSAAPQPRAFPRPFAGTIYVRRVCNLSGHLDRGSFGALLKPLQKSCSRLCVRLVRFLSGFSFHAANQAWSRAKHVPRISEAGA